MRVKAEEEDLEAPDAAAASSKVDEEEAEGGGGQEPLPGKIAHQAQSFVTRQAEMMLV